MESIRLPVENMQTTFANAPHDVETDTPRLSWQLPDGVRSQSEYRVRLARESGPLHENPIWDSGSVESSTPMVTYGGPTLDTGTVYEWTARIRDEKGHETEWSTPVQFETALGSGEWPAKWIAHPEGDASSPAPAFRRSFALDGEVERARLYVSSGGTYEIRLNGDRLDDRVLDPATTDYEERVLYASYNVIDRLCAGENVLGVVLGRGRYAMTTPNVWHWNDPPWHEDRPILRAFLDVTMRDGDRVVVGTDDSWHVTDSPTRNDSLYTGERYDAREEIGPWTERGVDCESWPCAAVVDGPAGELTPQRMQPMRPVETLKPDTITEPADGIYVIDFGLMTAGWVELTVDGPRGATVSVTYGERLNDGGFVDVDQEYVYERIQTDEYVLSGDETERWEPRFSYKGFRYVELRGLSVEPSPDDVRAKSIHTDVESNSGSRFGSSDDLLTCLHENTRRALLNNLHGIPTDTPVYEKNGWTGDAQLTAETAMYNFEMGPFYRKWLDDFADAQRPTGEIPPIVPTSDWGYSDAPKDGAIRSPNPAWDAAYVLLPWWVYQFYGDPDVLNRHYDGMTALLSFLDEYATNDVLDVGLGDWLAPGEGQIRSRPPEGPAITSTAYYYRMYEVVSRIAEILERPDDASRFAEHATEIRSSFNDRFFDPNAYVYTTSTVDEYRQTSNVFPLAFGMVPEHRRRVVVANLVSDVMETQGGHLNTGILGTKYLLGTLTENGFGNVAYTLASQETYPSWGYWVRNGATALYEAWELDSRTRDHHMFGTIDEWFYKYLAGVRPESPGFATVTIEPFVPTDLDRVSATVETVRGSVSVSWDQSGEAFSLDVTVPAGSNGVIHVPKFGDTIRVDSQDTVACEDIRLVSRNKNNWRYHVEPGSWSFVVD